MVKAYKINWADRRKSVALYSSKALAKAILQKAEKTGKITQQDINLNGRKFFYAVFPTKVRKVKGKLYIRRRKGL